MEQRAKIIIIALAVILALSLFMNAQSNSAKQTAQRRRDEVIKENNSLNRTLEEYSEKLQRMKELEENVTKLNSDVEKSSKEKEEIQKKYELLTKERDELVDQLKAVRTRRIETTVTPIPQSAAPSTALSDESYWGGVLRAKTDLEMQLASLRGEIKTSQIGNEQIQKERSALELDVNNLARENLELKRQFEYNKKILESISAELVIEKNDKFQLDSSFRTLKNENDILRRQIKGLTSRKIALERRLADLQKENIKVGEQSNMVNSLLKDSMSQIDNLKKRLDLGESETREVVQETTAAAENKGSVDLPPIVVRPQAEGKPSGEVSPSAGKILAVNRENNFVIIDLGENSVVRVGDTFGVYRGDQSIATLEVIQTRKDISACDIKSESSPIKIGDIVR